MRALSHRSSGRKDGGGKGTARSVAAARPKAGIAEPNKTRDLGVPDLTALLGLARERSATGRRALFATVRDLFLESEEALSDRERALMGEILRKLIGDVERSVRKALAERLAERGNAPRDLVVALANDEIEVAYPILLKSGVLHDLDLIEIIRHRSQAHQLAVAVRKEVSEEVSQALVEVGDPDVITTLLKNDDAAISRSLMEYLVAESKRVDSFQMPLVNRRDLPPDLARKMYWWVSTALRQNIVANFDVDPQTIDDAIDGTVKEALDRGDAGQPTKAERFADQAAERGQLTEEFLVSTLRQGEIPLFEACFAKATDVGLKVARRLIYEPGAEGLAVACKAAGFKRATFSTIFQLTRKVVPAGVSFEPREIARITQFFERVQRDHALEVVKRWRREANYLSTMNDREKSQ